jgi:Domain of unknown function (DUF4253)
VSDQGPTLTRVSGPNTFPAMAALAEDPTGSRLGLRLPAGRVVPDADGAPALWLSDAAVDGLVLEELHANVGRTGLWPVVLNGEGFTQPVQPDWPRVPFDAEAVLAGWSARYSRGGMGHTYDGCETCEATIQVRRSLPGAAFAAESDQDPGRTAAVVATGQLAHAPYLGLVACERSADILTAFGWDGPANRHDEIAQYSAVLGRWEEQYGVRVAALFGAILVCSVARPPRTLERALPLVAEQLAFCPDQSGLDPVDIHALSLIGTSLWWFWWD